MWQVDGASRSFFDEATALLTINDSSSLRSMIQLFWFLYITE
jgi:hypothetical protein